MRGQFLLALRYLTARKQRMVLTTLAIVFGVTILFGMNSLLPGMFNAFRHTMITSAGKVDLTVSSASNNPFNQDALGIVSAVDGVDASTGVLQRNVQIPASLGGATDPLTGSAAILLTGVDPATAGSVRRYTVDDGRFLENGDDLAAVISYNMARKLDLKPGDTLTLPSSEGTTELEVVGVRGQFDAAIVDEVFVPLSAVQRILHLPGQLTSIDILLNAGADQGAVETSLLQALGDQFKLGAVEVGNELTAMLGLGKNIMWLFGLMALAMAAFVIFNTFRTVVAERRRDLGMLRAVGASRKTVMQLILTESILQGVAGTLIGLILGYLFAYVTLKALEPLAQTYLRMSVGAPVITLENLLSAVVLGVGFTLGSAYFPARSAMKVTPLEAIRPVPQAVERRNTRQRAIIGLVLTVVSVAGLLLGGLQVASFSMLLFLVGLVLVIPVVVKPVADIFGKLINLVYARQGNLAQGNLKRQPGRASVTASAMMIGLAVTIAMIGLVTSMKFGFMSYLDKSLGADYLLMPESLVLGGGNMGAAPEFASELEKIDGIDSVTSLRLAASSTDNTALQVIGIDPLKYARVSGLEFNSGDEQSAYAAMQNGRAIIINGIFSSSSGTKIGDTITLMTAEGEKPYRVVGIAMDYLNAKLATGYISQANLQQDFHITTDVLIMANRTDGADSADVDAAMNAAVKKYPAFTLVDSAEFKAEQMKTLDMALSFMYALTLMLAIPGLIAMINTLTINIIERTREIGMLRAIGSTRRQVRQMVLGESLLLSALGTSLGIVVGIFLSYYMLKALQITGFKLDFYFPGVGILAAVAVGLLFGVLAALIPARQAARIPIVEALRYE